MSEFKHLSEYYSQHGSIPSSFDGDYQRLQSLILTDGIDQVSTQYPDINIELLQHIEKYIRRNGKRSEAETEFYNNQKGRIIMPANNKVDALSCISAIILLSTIITAICYYIIYIEPILLFSIIVIIIIYYASRTIFRDVLGWWQFH